MSTFDYMWLYMRMTGYAVRWRRLLAVSAALLLFIVLANYYVSTLGEQITPLQKIIVRGGDTSSRAAAEQLLEEIRGDNLMAIPVEKWRRKLENLPAVHQAHVKRVLPHTLLVSLERGEPLARWENGSLIDASGAYYTGSYDQPLPVFSGDADNIEKIAAFYRQATQILPGIAQVELTSRGSWKLFFNDGVLIHLGKKPLARLRYYAKHAAALTEKLPPLRVIDMRYEQGFAVQIEEEN